MLHSCLRTWTQAAAGPQQYLFSCHIRAHILKCITSREHEWEKIDNTCLSETGFFLQTTQLCSSWLKKSVHCACISCFPYLCACWWAPRLVCDLAVVTSDVIIVDVRGSLWDADLEVREQTSRRSLGSVEYLWSFWETFILIAIVGGWVYIPRSFVCFLLSTSLPTSAIS